MSAIDRAVILACSLLGGFACADAPACTPGQGYRPICGIAPPEDLEPTPVDNLSWGAGGRLLGAGIDDAGAFRRCFASHLEHCPVGLKVSALDTRSGEHRLLFTADAGVLAGASVAVEAGGALYVGAFTGDRLLRLALPPTDRAAKLNAPFARPASSAGTAAADNP